MLVKNLTVPMLLVCWSFLSALLHIICIIVGKLHLGPSKNKLSKGHCCEGEGAGLQELGLSWAIPAAPAPFVSGDFDPEAYLPCQWQRALPWGKPV